MECATYDMIYDKTGVTGVGNSLPSKYELLSKYNQITISGSYSDNELVGIDDIHPLDFYIFVAAYTGNYSVKVKINNGNLASVGAPSIGQRLESRVQNLYSYGFTKPSDGGLFFAFYNNYEDAKTGNLEKALLISNVTNNSTILKCSSSNDKKTVTILLSSEFNNNFQDRISLHLSNGLTVLIDANMYVTTV